jgi:hypothetical protein
LKLTEVELRAIGFPEGSVISIAMNGMKRSEAGLPSLIIQNIIQFFIIGFGIAACKDFVGFDKVIKQRIVFMNQQGIKDIDIAGSNNTFELNNGAVIVHLKPVSKFVKAGHFTVVAVIADINNSIFFSCRNTLSMVVTVTAMRLSRGALFNSSGLNVSSRLKPKTLGANSG